MINVERGMSLYRMSDSILPQEYTETIPPVEKGASSPLEKLLLETPGIYGLEQTVLQGKRVWRAVGSPGRGGIAEGESLIQAITLLKKNTDQKYDGSFDYTVMRNSELTNKTGALVNSLFAGKDSQYIFEMVENNITSLKRNWEVSHMPKLPWEAFMTYVNRKWVGADEDGPARSQASHQTYLMSGMTMAETLGKGWLFARFGIHPDRDILGSDDDFIYLQGGNDNEELRRISGLHMGNTGVELKVSREKLREYIDQPGIPAEVSIPVSITEIRDQINKKRLPEPFFAIPISSIGNEVSSVANVSQKGSLDEEFAM